MPLRRVVDSRFDPFSESWTPAQIEAEYHRVVNGRVQLIEAPDVDYDITVKYTASSVALTETTSSPNVGEYRVDRTYNTGLLQFNSSENDEEVNVDYYGKGSPVLARDHNTGYKSGFLSGFGGDGSDGELDISTKYTFIKTINQFTSLTVGATVTVGSTCSGVLCIAVQGRLTITSDGWFNLNACGATRTATGAVGNSDPVFGYPATATAPGRAVGSYAGGGGAGSGTQAKSGGGGVLGGDKDAAVGSARNGVGMPSPNYLYSSSTEALAKNQWHRFLDGRPLGVGGSGGGGGDSGNGRGGPGGGALFIECDELYIESTLKSGWVTVTGGDGENTTGGGGGGGTAMIVCNRIIKGTDDAATREAYLCTQSAVQGGNGANADAGDGASGFIVVIELDPDGRD